MVTKIADKVKSSKLPLKSQHIGKSLLGLQGMDPETPEVKYLLKEITKRIAQSDRTKLTSTAIADSLYGLQGMNSKVGEVQNLLSELAKKIAFSPADLSPTLIGRALFGLQGISSEASIFAESGSALRVYYDSDEAQFLVSTLWDKIKTVNAQMSLSAIAMGLQGILKPHANLLFKFFF